jgi:hypothetical protein
LWLVFVVQGVLGLIGSAAVGWASFGSSSGLTVETPLLTAAISLRLVLIGVARLP